jgi:hypothetical protein
MLEAIGDDATGCARGATLEAFLERGVAHDVRDVVAWHARPDDADDPTPRRTPEAFATAVSDRKAARVATVPRPVPRFSVSQGATAFRRLPRRTAAPGSRRREGAPWA